MSANRSCERVTEAIMPAATPASPPYPMSKLDSLNELFIEELHELHGVETQLLKALPAMEKVAHNEALRFALNEHFHQTGTHVNRLEQIFGVLGETLKAKPSKVMKNLLAEGQKQTKSHTSPAVRDVALIACAQRVEHYEIAGYGTARTFAETLGYNEVAEMLQATLEEESGADERLTQLAQVLNVEAMVRADLEVRD